MLGTRGCAVSLVVLQFVALVAAFAFRPEKRPLFVYTTSVSTTDALSMYNASGFTIWFRRDGLPASVAAERSTVHVMEVVSFALFMFPAFLGCIYTFSSVRLVSVGELSTEAAYGEHGIHESLSWEVSFWTLVFAQHVVAQCVLSSPADLLYVMGTSFAAMILLLCFCTLAVNTDVASPTRAFDGPVAVMLALVYVLIVYQTKTTLGEQTTFFAWFVYIALHAMLVFGHNTDNPLSCRTVLNCRWTYVVASCWANVVLYVLY
jgi:hypothetical protein